jgi:hypothetical protein
MKKATEFDMGRFHPPPTPSLEEGGELDHRIRVGWIDPMRTNNAQLITDD